ENIYPRFNPFNRSNSYGAMQVNIVEVEKISVTALSFEANGEIRLPDEDIKIYRFSSPLACCRDKRANIIRCSSKQRSALSIHIGEWLPAAFTYIYFERVEIKVVVACVCYIEC